MKVEASFSAVAWEASVNLSSDQIVFKPSQSLLCSVIKAFFFFFLAIDTIFKSCPKERVFFFLLTLLAASF